MNYLLDQGLARSTVEYLREMGIESEHVGNLGMAATSDREILDEGRKRGWVAASQAAYTAGSRPRMKLVPSRFTHAAVFKGR